MTLEDHVAIQKVRDAMQDLLMSPMGVVPKSAEPFFSNGRISTTKLREHMEGHGDG